ncbi:MAG TPA: hypothetical protein VFV35_06305, partial [Acidimicrobiales bacterium]|nr:hypothetical protein [Acidimicrobiales bacterium]
MAETSGTGTRGPEPSPAAMTATIDAPVLRRVVEVYGRALSEHRDALNRLNVYPVPDGDTGTNMALTLESVVAELGDHRE